MQRPIPSASEYGQAMLALLPRGPVWPREPDSVLYRVMGALAPTYVRSHKRSGELIEEAFPATTNELLAEWEATMGLPDPCAGEAPTFALRRAQVVAKLTGRGGQSKEYFIAVALSLGFAITITEFREFCADDPCEGPLYGDLWAFAWQVNAPLVSLLEFEADTWRADDPLAIWGNAILECALQAIKPAHTTLLFSYT